MYPFADRSSSSNHPMPVNSTKPGYPTRDAIVCGPAGSDRRSQGDNASTTRAAASNPTTYGAGAVNHPMPSRPSANARSVASGHGTRPSHAAALQTASADATPIAGASDRRLNCSMPNPASIQPAHCQPADCNKPRIASFFVAIAGA